MKIKAKNIDLTRDFIMYVRLSTSKGMQKCIILQRSINNIFGLLA